LPPDAPKTEILIDNEIIQLDVSEGDIVSFPAYIFHRSPPNKGRTKTIISFNTSFLGLLNYP